MPSLFPRGWLTERYAPPFRSARPLLPYSLCVHCAFSSMVYIPISEHVTIYYPWCSRFGLSLPVLRRMRQQQGDSLICETPEGNAFALPAWMADRAVCAAFSLGPPVASVFALRTLRVFLDGLHP